MVTPPGAWLSGVGAAGEIPAPPQLWGLGGLHGGLELALLARIMREHAPDRTSLRSATARFHRRLTSTAALTTRVQRTGRLSAVRAEVLARHQVVADASALFAAGRKTPTAPVHPSAPTAPAPEDCELLTPRIELVPIAAFTEIRAVGPARPYVGGVEPELIAWVRLTEDDLPPDAYRLIFMMDLLAPSYAAVLPEFVGIPTIQMTAILGNVIPPPASPWILLRARTLSARPDGWVDEQIDAWGRDGTHLASAHQLRLVLDGPSS